MRGFGAEAVRHALSRMAELGYLDDRAYAEQWVRSRMSSKNEGWKALYRGLLGKGVPRALAEEVVTAQCSPQEELVSARALAAGLTAALAARRLAGRGFRSRTIAAVLREM